MHLKKKLQTEIQDTADTPIYSSQKQDDLSNEKGVYIFTNQN